MMKQTDILNLDKAVRNKAIKGERRMKWLDLGMSDPLTLGMAHPLADRLECLASRKMNKGVSRSITGLLMVTVAIATAPFTIASETVFEEAEARSSSDLYPTSEAQLKDTVVSAAQLQSEAEGKAEGHKHSNSKITVSKSNDDGKQTYVIDIKGDEIKAYKLARFGKKTAVPLKDIVGYDKEKAATSNSWSFDINDKNQLVFSASNEKAIHKHDYIRDFPHAEVMRKREKEIESRRLTTEARAKTMEKHREAAMARAEESMKRAEESRKHIQRIEIKRLENLKDLEKLKGLEALKDLEKLEGLESLESLADYATFMKDSEGANIIVLDDGTKKIERYIWSGDMPTPPDVPKGLNAPKPPAAPQLFADQNSIIIKDKYLFSNKFGDDGHKVFHFNSDDHSFFSSGKHGAYSQQARLNAATSMLESVEGLLEELDGEDKAQRDLAEARRDLKRAKKALRDAEKKIMKAQEKAQQNAQ